MNEREMRNRIINFGIPPIKKDRNKDLQLLFEDKDIKGTMEEEYQCKVNDVKFCLYSNSKNLYFR